MNKRFLPEDWEAVETLTSLGKRALVWLRWFLGLIQTKADMLKNTGSVSGSPWVIDGVKHFFVLYWNDLNEHDCFPESGLVSSLIQNVQHIFLHIAKYATKFHKDKHK